ncbi:MAG: hypothetical protein JWO79_2984, partial [Actinomycetia bacterium]|nr:hypothetical protein [Actinomycetes bacterium]
PAVVTALRERSGHAGQGGGRGEPDARGGERAGPGTVGRARWAGCVMAEGGPAGTRPGGVGQGSMGSRRIEIELMQYRWFFAV